MCEERPLIEVIEKVAEEVRSHGDIPPSLDNEIQEWIEKQGLDRIDDSEKTLYELAAFNWLIKTTLYKVYRSEGANLQPLEPDVDLHSNLLKARHETEDRAFSENPLDKLLKDTEVGVFSPLLDVREQVRELESAPDKIGSLFEQILPQVARRKLGQFRTLELVGELMAQWAIQNSDDTALDPGVGAGVLTAHMYDAKQATGRKARIEEMWGVDLSELAVVMASAALKITNGEGAPNFVVDDFLETVVDGSTSRLDQKKPHAIPKVDAIVSNPPYSRSHELKEVKDLYQRIIKNEFGISVSGKAPLYVYFIIHATQFLKEGGRMALITPGRFLETNYGVDLREFLINNFAIHGMLLLDSEISAFDGANTDPCITLLERKKSGEPNCKTTFMQIDEWPGNDAILDAVTSNVNGETSFGFVNQVKQSHLLPDVDWTSHVDEKSVDSIPGLKLFSEIATIKRGIATGKNDFFCLTQSEVDDWNLDARYLAPIVRRTNNIPDYELCQDDWDSLRDDNDACWLLYCYDEEDRSITEITDPSLQAYLDYGEEVGASNSYLGKNRPNWYVVEKREPPTILVTYMSKVGFRFVHNKAGVRSLNNLHNVELDGYDEREVEALLAYLNSSVANEITKRSGRTYSQGLHKIEPNELKEVPVIDPKELSEDELDSLSGCFQDVCREAKKEGDSLVNELAKMDEKVADVLSSNRKSLDLPVRDAQ